MHLMRRVMTILISKSTWGMVELGGLWSISDKHSLELMLRNNFRSDNKGCNSIGLVISYQ